MFYVMARLNGHPDDPQHAGRHSRLEHAADLEQARKTLLALASQVDPDVTVAMLAEALVQIERIGPSISGEAWEAYLAVERAAAPCDPQQR